MGVTAVVMVGSLKGEIAGALAQRYAAVALPDLDPGAAAGVRVAVTSGVWGVRSEHLDVLPGLGAIVNFGVGYDTTDVEEATRRGVVVANTPDVLTDCVADTAVGLVIDVMRGLSAADRFVRRGEWEAAGRGRCPGGSPARGSASSGWGASVVPWRTGSRPSARRSATTAARRNPRSRTATRPPRETSRPVATCSSSRPRAAPGSAGLVDAGVLDALGPRGFLVNVARGSVLDEGALVAALEAGRLAGAGLDVFADEPHVPQALLRRDDVVLLPHLASGTVETRAAMVELVLENVEAFLTRGRLVTPV